MKTMQAEYKTDIARLAEDAAKRDAEAAKRETRLILAMAGFIAVAVAILSFTGYSNKGPASKGAGPFSCLTRRHKRIRTKFFPKVAHRVKSRCGGAWIWSKVRAVWADGFRGKFQ